MSRPTRWRQGGDLAILDTMTSRAVSIADLKNNLSAHLARVRAGEELLVRDRRTPIAKIVPLEAGDDIAADEAALAAEGKVRLPRKALPPSFWRSAGPKVAGDRALAILRDERDRR
jgi:prevent-host-death family protein